MSVKRSDGLSMSSWHNLPSTLILSDARQATTIGVNPIPATQPGLFRPCGVILGALNEVDRCLYVKKICKSFDLTYFI